MQNLSRCIVYHALLNLARFILDFPLAKVMDTPWYLVTFFIRPQSHGSKRAEPILEDEVKTLQTTNWSAKTVTCATWDFRLKHF